MLGRGSRWVRGMSCRCLWLGRTSAAGHQLPCTARKPSTAAGLGALLQRIGRGVCSRAAPRGAWSSLLRGFQAPLDVGWAIALLRAPFHHQHLVSVARVTRGWLPIAAASQRAPASISRVPMGVPLRCGNARPPHSPQAARKGSRALRAAMMSLSPETQRTGLPPRSFLSSQFARGLGEWEALWAGDPLLQSGESQFWRAAALRFPTPSAGSLAGPDGTVCNK